MAGAGPLFCARRNGHMLNFLSSTTIIGTLCSAITVSDKAIAGEELPKESVIASIEISITTCMPLPLGLVHVRPSDESQIKFLHDLQTAGIITLRNTNSSTGNVWKYLEKLQGAEVGEGDVDVSILPNVDMRHFIQQKCLKVGKTVVDSVKIVTWDESSVKDKSLTTKKIIVVQGTYERHNDFDDLYLAYVKASGLNFIVHGKFRMLFEYDPFQKKWIQSARDDGEISESGFRSSNVEQRLAN